MSFFVDSSDQREKARIAERRLLEHEQARPHLINAGRIRPDEEFMLPKSGAYVDLTRPTVQPDYEDHVPSTAPDKYAARFRDGLPPPTPPALRDQPPRPVRRLIPQQELDARHAPREIRRTSRADLARDPVPDPVPDMRWTNQFPEADRMMATTPLVPDFTQPLTKSQKKRRRRKRKQQETGETGGITSPNGHDHDPDTLPLPSPLPPYPDEPPPSSYPIQTRCDAILLIKLPDGSTHEIICPLTPFPHPGQPHLLQLQTEPGATAFVGFWLEGE